MASTRNFNDEIQQALPFKSSIIEYILENINQKHLLKLYETCKFFPNKFPAIIVDRICVSEYPEFFYYKNQKISVNGDTRVWITDEIRLYAFRNLSWITNFWIFTIKNLDVCHKLTINELKILIYHGKIKSLDIGGVKDENGMPIPVEDIIDLVPTIPKIRLGNAFVTPETFLKLASLKRKTKFVDFGLRGVKEIINSDEILKFLEIHASRIRSTFGIRYDFNISRKDAERFLMDLRGKMYFQKRFEFFKEKPNFYATGVPQKIKFKSSIIEYILEHISHKHLLKLYLTCKYFPNQFSLIIFDKLIVYVKSEYVVCEDVKYPLEYFSKIWTVNEICLYGSRADHSLWMSKAYISTLNKLVANGTLSLKDFKFLIQNDMVEDIEIDDIKDENGKFLSVEEIISLVPNAYVIA
uniref:F-box domain-containing protein n=1 Tax=Panagrolaimus davidi TaxID=227884 RepID=A0A914PSV0_9BILA